MSSRFLAVLVEANPKVLLDLSFFFVGFIFVIVKLQGILGTCSNYYLFWFYGHTSVEPGIVC